MTNREYCELSLNHFSKLAIEFVNRPSSGPDGWQPRNTANDRDRAIFQAARLAAHYAIALNAASDIADFVDAANQMQARRFTRRVLSEVL